MSALALTGPHIIVVKEGTSFAALKSRNSTARISCADASECGPNDDVCALAPGSGVFYEHLGVLRINALPGQIAAAHFGNNGPFVCVEPERRLRAIKAPERKIDFASESAPDISGAATTWGLVATRVHECTLTGKETRVCVLDSGINLDHPDFVARKDAIEWRSFTGSTTIDDPEGHGTHCAGTICGPPNPSQGPRYGIASDAMLMVGKVLDDRGESCDGRLIAGINWAVGRGADVVSMSLGEAVAPDAPYSRCFELVARRALERGTLLIAAAGNDSVRGDGGKLLPVHHPANCPSVMAIGAVDTDLDMAYESNAGLNGHGGKIDLVAPGVDVRSAWTKDIPYYSPHGTSMAVPFISGISLLYRQANPQVRGYALKEILLRNARRLPLPWQDVGFGLVQAPWQKE